MPAAIPVIASFAAASSAVAAAGGIVAALGTVTGFLSIAGAALTTVGALTGKKDLLKVGGLMTLGSSLWSAASSASSAAGEVAAEEAAKETFRASEYEAAAKASEGVGAGITPQTAGLEQATTEAAKAGSGAEAIDPMERANQFFESGESGSSAIGGDRSIMDTARETFRRGEFDKSSIYAKATQPSGVTIGGEVMNMAPAGMPSGVTINGQVVGTAPSDPVAQFARGMTSDQIEALNGRIDTRAKVNLGVGAPSNPLSKLSAWLESNPNQALIAGKMLAGALGPEAEELDFKKSIYERRRANLNSPVALTFGKA